MKILLLSMTVVLAGCTDADMAHMSQFNDPAHVQCFSGGKVVYNGQSTGKIASNANEDGLYFKEKETGKFVRLYADCVVRTL